MNLSRANPIYSSAKGVPRGARRLTGRAIAAPVLVALALAGPASAQDVSDAHLAAARDAVGAIGATQQFDNILLGAALNLKSQLIQTNPDQQAVISATVDEVALQLAGRRGDLETEAARVYANYFTEGELASIAEFYGSEAGQKLIANGPQATRDVLRAADIWGRGIGRDLAQSVGTVLQERIGGAAPAQAPDGTPQAPATQ